jgi:hypothetical protein
MSKSHKNYTMIYHDKITVIRYITIKDTYDQKKNIKHVNTILKIANQRQSTN